MQLIPHSGKASKLSQSVLILGFGIFFTFAILQLNDANQYANHDAWIWVLIYGLMALINLAMIWFHIGKHWLFGWAGFAWGALFFRIQDAQGNLHIEWLNPRNFWQYDEENVVMVQHTNEAAGLLVLALWACLTCYLAISRQR